MGSFEILERISSVTYKLKLPQELSSIHDTFHVSNLNKCLADESLIIPLDKIRVNDKLHFVEESLEIIDRKVKRLRRVQIPIVMIRWNSQHGPEFTWEREKQMKQQYPLLFSDKNNIH